MSIILAAVLVGMIYVYPDLRFMMDAGKQYKGVAAIGFTDETLYMGRLNAVYKNDFTLRNPAIYEHRYDPVIMPSLCEFLEAQVGRLLKLDVTGLDMLATFTLPALLFMLTVLLSYSISGMRAASIAAGLAVLLGMHFFSRPFILSGRICNPNYTLPLWFSRPITPQMHFVFFLSALVFIYKAIRDKKTVSIFLGGAFLGSLFYVSVFYWVYIYALLGVLVIVFLLDRDIRTAGHIIYMSLIAALVSIPYWIENLKTMANPEYNLLLYRFNIAYTHKPILPLAAVALMVFLFAARKQITAASGKTTFYFLLSMVLAVIITLNQQILTGRLFKESHWTTYTGKFAFLVAGLLLAASVLRYFQRGRRLRIWLSGLVFTLFIGLLFTHAAALQANYYRHHFGENLKLQELGPLLNWLNVNLSNDDVILPSPGDIRLSESIPIYTKSFVYYSEPFFCMSLIPAEETRYRMLASYRLFGFELKDAACHPYAWDGAIFLTNDTNRTWAFMEDQRRIFISEYTRMLGRDGLELAKRYKVDYIVAVKDRDEGTIERLVGAGARQVYKDKQFCVIEAGGRNG